MAGRLSKQVDLLFTSDGDLALGEDGDLADTQNVLNRDMIQRIVTRVGSSPGDWAYSPNVGANLSAVMGQRNTREQGQRIEQIITSALMRDSFLRSTEFAVTAYPVNQHVVGVVLTISPIDVRGRTVMTFSYDMRDNRMIPRTI